MTKRTKYIIAVVAGILLLGGGVLAYSNSQKETVVKSAPKEDTTQTENANPPATPATATPEQPAQPQNTAGSYVTLSDYNSNTAKYASAKKVYFFHAGWCPICVNIDEDFKDGTTKIPENTVFIKTDFDSQTDLRKKYGVTTQYTFVQVDSGGNETSQWTASTSSKAVAGVKT